MIETDRLILRPFCAEDAADVFEYLKEPMVNCFACMKVHSMEEAQKAVMERAEDVEYTFAIVLKKNGKGTEKIKNAKQIKLSFTIAKNVTSSTGDKTVYARIFQPDMEVLVKSEANRFPYENKEIQYSIKKSFEYTGEETSIDMYWNIEETLQKGEYTVYFFVDGNMIGEGKGTFK